MLIEMYGLKNPKLQFKKNKIYISDDSQNYELHVIKTKEQSKKIKELQKLNNYNINQIVKNINNQAITKYNINEYILTKIEKTKTSILDIIKKNLSNTPIIIKNKEFSEWFFLWIEKNERISDIYMYHYNNIDNVISESIFYFLGMAENAIEYYKNIDENLNVEFTISHQRIHEITNPLNIIIDQKERDIGEYIKYIFIEKKVSLTQFDEIIEIMLQKNLSFEKVYSRLLYPTFYFDELELYLLHSQKKDTLKKYIKRIYEYEKYLKYIYMLFSKKVPIKKIDWLN